MDRVSLNGLNKSDNRSEINRRVIELEKEGHKVIDITPYFHNNESHGTLALRYVMIKYITKDEIERMYKGKHHKEVEQ
jgi:hypothetical protein